jgi:hypothetical protein
MGSDPRVQALVLRVELIKVHMDSIAFAKAQATAIKQACGSPACMQLDLLGRTPLRPGSIASYLSMFFTSVLCARIHGVVASALHARSGVVL